MLDDTPASVRLKCDLDPSPLWVFLQTCSTELEELKCCRFRFDPCPAFLSTQEVGNRDLVSVPNHLLSAQRQSVFRLLLQFLNLQTTNLLCSDHIALNRYDLGTVRAGIFSLSLPDQSIHFSLRYITPIHPQLLLLRYVQSYDCRDQLFKDLFGTLKRDGFLFIGHSETGFKIPDTFIRVAPSVYQKRSEAAR